MKACRRDQEVQILFRPNKMECDLSDFERAMVVGANKQHFCERKYLFNEKDHGEWPVTSGTTIIKIFT